MAKLPRPQAPARFRALYPDLADWLEAPWTGPPPFLTGQVFRLEETIQDDRYVIRAELPGLDPEKDIEVSIDGRILTIRAERRQRDTGPYHSEFRYGSLARAVRLPNRVEPAEVTARYDKGVLEVSVPARRAELAGSRGTTQPALATAPAALGWHLLRPHLLRRHLLGRHLLGRHLLGRHLLRRHLLGRLALGGQALGGQALLASVAQRRLRVLVLRVLVLAEGLRAIGLLAVLGRLARIRLRLACLGRAVAASAPGAGQPRLSDSLSLRPRIGSRSGNSRSPSGAPSGPLHSSP